MARKQHRQLSVSGVATALENGSKGDGSDVQGEGVELGVVLFSIQPEDKIHADGSSENNYQNPLHMSRYGEQNVRESLIVKRDNKLFGSQKISDL